MKNFGMKHWLIGSGAVLGLQLALSACGATPGQQGGDCLNNSFDSTSCVAGLACLDDCGGGGGLPPKLGCSPHCDSCEAVGDVVGDNGLCVAVPSEGGEGEGEGE